MTMDLSNFQWKKRPLGVHGLKHFEPEHDKTNKMICAPSKDSDQPNANGIG